ncbi:hypothetical protein B0H14DRAFT_3737985 [Mycena olivaceomarginata]|nr:hypothetical protein B0H14DRAFT_3737985 [Mycena olivaceomarginata]
MQWWVPQILVLYSPILVNQGIAAVASSDIFTQHKYARKVALASERYRNRKRDEEHAEWRAADAVTRQARGIEKDALHRKHTKLKNCLTPFPSRALLHRAVPLPRYATPPSFACLPSPLQTTTRLMPNPAKRASITLPSRQYGQRAPPAPRIVVTATRRTASVARACA